MPKVSHHAARSIAAIADRMAAQYGHLSAARSLQTEVNRLSGGVEALDRVNVNRNPLETDAAHAVKVAKMARTFDKEITAGVNRAAQALRDGLQDVQRRIDQKVNLTPDAFASEIRTAFRGLDGKGRAELINTLVKENRGPELAAIVKAPPVLTGISEAQRATYENMIIATHASDELDESKALEEAFDSASAAQRTASSFVKELTDPGYLAAIERGEAIATAAGDAFNQSIAPN